MASTAAAHTFRRVWSDPSILHRQSQAEDRLAYYHLLNAYYENSVFDEISRWQNYKSVYRLYRQTRSIYNPTRRLVNFYKQHVYRGRLSMDGQPFTDGTPIAIPFTDEASPELLLAIAQVWQWTNWLDGKDLVVGLAAINGECLVEVVDEVEKSKVTFEIRWPGFVDQNYLELDAAGNVKQYAIEYQAEDENGNGYIYRKEVDQAEIRTYKDEKLFDYGSGPIVENSYGFVPAVWCRHEVGPGVAGAPAIAGSINKIDELNSIASLIHDEMAKIIASPVLLKGTGKITSLFAKEKSGPTDEEEPQPDAEREEWAILKGGPDAGIEKLPIGLAEGMPYLESLMNEIERDFPELSMYERLSDMSQITGPGADRLMGNVAATLDQIAARHDQQTIKLFAMAVAIGGERLRRGEWQERDRQREKFRPFNLQSYVKGDLDLEIKPRRLFPLTDRELVDQDKVRADLAVTLDGIVDPLEQLYLAGYTEEQAQEIMERKARQNAIDFEQERELINAQAANAIDNADLAEEDTTREGEALLNP